MRQPRPGGEECIFVIAQRERCGCGVPEVSRSPRSGLNCSLAALAPLGLGRAYALQGEPTKAKTEYQDFLTLWKDADPDIPILKQAKAEYAKLR